MILLDTQVLVWLAFGDERLGAHAIALVEDDDLRCVSAMAFWEIAMLTEKRRLLIGMPVQRWIERLVDEMRLEEIAITGAIAVDAGALPGNIHGDPADRMMIATARALGCVLLTADEKILAYAARGYLKAMDARV